MQDIAILLSAALIFLLVALAIELLWDMDRNMKFSAFAVCRCFQWTGSEKFQISWRYAYYFPAVHVSQCCDGVLMWCFRVASEVNEGVRCWLSNLRSCGTSSCGTECYSGAAHISENICRLVGWKDPADRTVTNVASCQAGCQLTDSTSLAVTALTWYRLYMCECGKAVASSEPWPNI